jgi:hypothetical protein
MNREDFGYCLHLNNDELSNDKIQTVSAIERDAVILNRQGNLPLKGDPT